MQKREDTPHTYESLIRIVERLRGPDGCPWDREQTHASMKAYILEECYELIEAIEQGDPDRLVEELGDLLFHVLFQMQLGQEEGGFTPTQVYGSVIEKLVRRHPHVFAGALAADARQVEAAWEEIKRQEKAGTDTSTLEGVPKSMPALAYAQAVQVRASRSGFDWEGYEGVLEKIGEELAEVEAARSQADREREVGDLLFSVVNATRWLDTDAESALRQANGRFYRRFATMERLSRDRGVSFSDLGLEDKEALWQEAKGLEG